jgi:hypothetical protein
MTASTSTAMLTRRRFLASTAVIGLVALVPGLARAFSLETADPDAERLYLTACGGQDAETHRRIVAELRQELAGKSEAEVEAAIAAATCPVCGCGVGLAR